MSALFTAIALVPTAVISEAGGAAVRWQSSAQYGTYAMTVRGVRYYWNNDAWCSGHGPQTIWVNWPGDWGVTSRQTFSTDCWVQTYPHIGWWGGKRLSAYPRIIGNEAEKGPGHSSRLQWEAAYDIWLNASSAGADNGYEIMIWDDVSGVSPGGPVIATPTIGGVRYRFYQGAGGNGPVSDFVRTSNAVATVTDIRPVISYAVRHVGNYKGPPDPVVSTVEFGWEVWGTGGAAVRFHMSRFSMSG